MKTSIMLITVLALAMLSFMFVIAASGCTALQLEEARVKTLQVADVTNDVSAVLPPPLNVYVGFAGTLIGLAAAGIAAYQKTKAEKATESIAKSIEAVKDEHGKVDFNDPATITTLNAVQTPKARQIVDSVQ